MKANVSMGVHCPKCQITIGTMVSIGGNNNCPKCGEEMIAATSTPTRVISNFKCACGTQIGHMSVVGSDARCPGCNKLI